MAHGIAAAGWATVCRTVLGLLFIAWLCVSGSHETWASLIYYYTGNELHNQSPPHENRGRVTGVASFKDLPEGFTGTAVATSCSLSALGMTLSCYDEASTSLTLNSFIFSNGNVEYWNIYLTAAIPHESNAISTAGAPAFGVDIAQLWPLQTQSNIPGTWSRTPPPPPSTSPPTTLQLAQLSADAYNSSPTGITDYRLLTHLDYGNGLVANVYGSPDNSQLVMAFKGTTVSSPFKNLLADAAVGAGVRNPLLDTYVNQAAQALTILANANLESNITVTGHSLGGALAQLLGTASGVDSVVFDAPGIAKLYPLYETTLKSSLPILEGGGVNNNYRLYGDQVSLAGDQIGRVFTVGNDGGPTSWFDVTGWLTSHSIDNLAKALESETPTPDTKGPDFSLLIDNIILPLTESLPVLTFVQVVSAFEHYFIDPDSYDRFTLIEDAGSPYLHSLRLPALDDVSYYKMRYRMGDVWSEFQILLPDIEEYFGFGVDGIEFMPFNEFGIIQALQTFWLFDVTFSSSGIFSATLYQEISTAAVLEPTSWMIALTWVGILFFIFSYGGHRRKFA